MKASDRLVWDFPSMLETRHRIWGILDLSPSHIDCGLWETQRGSKTLSRFSVHIFCSYSNPSASSSTCQSSMATAIFLERQCIHRLLSGILKLWEDSPRLQNSPRIFHSCCMLNSRSMSRVSGVYRNGNIHQPRWRIHLPIHLLH